ncbi:MAG: hypothetical protein K2G23_06240, partial [Muribaculaceae bacterium]|nr:hypothetical protein [Muribaculaceae bacterium]
MNKYITYILTLIFTLGLTSCRDDFFGNIFEHEGNDVVLDIDFMPAGASDLETRASLWSFPGDGMSDIRDLCLVLFNESDQLEEIIDISNVTDDITYIETEENRTEADTSNGLPTTETVSKRRKYRLKLPTGKYYVYAVANLGTYTADAITTSTYNALHTMDISDRSKFRSYRKIWQADNFRNNSEMTGICTIGALTGNEVFSSTSEKTMDENPIYLRPGINLHCWLRRLASKVTVDFDAANLD